jgi:GT2 family glycosyltransferase
MNTSTMQRPPLNSGVRASLPPSSLIICSRNRPQLLLDCVQSVLEGDEVPTELVIVDDSDMPHGSLQTLSTSRPCELRYMWTRSAGLSRANNDGIAAARYDVLVFTQDDVLVTPDWFGSIVRALIKTGRHSVVTGQVLPGEPETSGAFAPSTKADDQPAIYEGRIGADVLYLQNMAVYRSAIQEVGHFDQRLGPGTAFPGAEDNDFGFRLLESGYRIIYEPQAVTYHRAWRAQQDYISLYWKYGHAQGAYYAKYFSLKDGYMLGRMMRDIKDQFLRLARALWHRSSPTVNAVYIFGLISGASRWFLTQRRKPAW